MVKKTNTPRVPREVHDYAKLLRIEKMKQLKALKITANAQLQDSYIDMMKAHKRLKKYKVIIK